MKIKIAVLLQCVLPLCSHSVSAVTIEMVMVGNPGNAPSSITTHPVGPVGSVPYSYLIGKYEVTAGQYTEFLNAVAADDPHGLYNDAMNYDADPSARGCNIQRTGVPGEYHYSVAADWADRPVNYVSVFDALRFVNWLHNGQPQGAQGPNTTEDGAYSALEQFQLPVSYSRNSNARLFLPSVNEWFKAAYHNKSTGTDGSYFTYPTGTDAFPGTDPTEATNSGNNMNAGDLNAPTFGPPYIRTAVGEFELSASPYGTFDQGGNVAEWTDTNYPFKGPNAFRWANSSYEYYVQTAEAISQFAQESPGEFPYAELPALGFRIAAAAPVPEPTSLALFSIAAVMLGGSRYRTRRGQAS